MRQEPTSPLLGETASGLGKRGWILACLGALVLHAGGAAAIISHLDPSDPDSALGAPAIEVGIVLETPTREATDLPPGPPADDAAASPAAQEQKATVEETELPKAMPTETDDPDRVVSPQATEKPKEEETTKATVTTSASQESVASEAAAPAAIESAPQTERSAAPAIGTGESAQLVRATWQKELIAHLNRFKKYPPGASRKNVEIVVSFTLDRSGHVVASGILKGSGDAAFDDAALAMMKRSDPVPIPPPRVADEGLTFTLPVIFRRGRG